MTYVVLYYINKDEALGGRVMDPTMVVAVLGIISIADVLR
jgi:hypothetical protein